MRGANYVPSYAHNDIQIWVDYDPTVVDRELVCAGKLKLNCVRVFLHVAAYERDPQRFLNNFESFLGLCEKHRMRMMPVLFDSCCGPPSLEKYRDKDWVACPGQDRLDKEHWPALEKYVRDVVGGHKDDKRVVMWDVMNEPTCTPFYQKEEGKKLIHAFVRRALDRVKAQKPSQPRTVGLRFSSQLSLVQDQVDVLAFHNYERDLREDIQKAREIGRRLGKPVIVNEVVMRPQQPFHFAMPILREEKIGWVFWELMLGKTQFSRGDNPIQGIVYPDGACRDAREVAAVMNISLAEAKQLFPQRRWTTDEAWDWYRKQPWIVGFNYVPSTAANTTEFWSAETFHEKTIDRELGWAHGLGFTTTRVFIQYIVWKHDPAGFKKRFEKFLALAAKHGVSVMPVPFDDCTFGTPKQHDPFLGKQREPLPGMILPSWTPSPGRKLGGDLAERPALKRYVQDMLATFGKDERVIVWDLFNEPMGPVEVGQPALLEEIFTWAGVVRPQQPLTMGVWNDNAAVNRVMLARSDVISFHRYASFAGLQRYIAEMKKHGRPLICTEWMALRSAAAGKPTCRCSRSKASAVITGAWSTAGRNASLVGAINLALPSPKSGSTTFFTRTAAPTMPPNMTSSAEPPPTKRSTGKRLTTPGFERRCGQIHLPLRGLHESS